MPVPSAAETALADIGVIALQLLLGGKLGAVIRRLLAPLAVLAGAVFAPVQRALGAAPQIDAETAVDLVLRFLALAHVSRIRFRFFPASPLPPRKRVGQGERCCPNRAATGLQSAPGGRGV